MPFVGGSCIPVADVIPCSARLTSVDKDHISSGTAFVVRPERSDILLLRLAPILPANSSIPFALVSLNSTCVTPVLGCWRILPSNSRSSAPRIGFLNSALWVSFVPRTDDARRVRGTRTASDIGTAQLTLINTFDHPLA